MSLTLFIPAKKKDFEVKSLDDAYIILFQAFEDYAQSHNLEESDREAIKKLIEEAYIAKKTERFIANKVGIHMDYLGNYFNFMLEKFTNENHRSDSGKLKYNAFYIKHLKELVNE